MTATRLVLHVGLPKCASSAVQVWADGNRDALAASGVDYPESTPGFPAPKHQELVALMHGEDAPVARAFLARTRSPTLFLSTEGLSNSLYDAPEAALARFRDLMGGGCDTAILMTRAPGDWLRSYWKQCLTNPLHPAMGYGLALPLDEFARMPRVARLMDLPTLETDLARALGARRVVRIDAGSDWRDDLAGILGVDPARTTAPVRWHQSVSDAEAEAVRQMNALGLVADERADFLALLQIATGSASNTLRDHARDRGAGLLQRRDRLRGYVAAIRPESDAEHATVASLVEALDRLG